MQRYYNERLYVDKTITRNCRKIISQVYIDHRRKKKSIVACKVDLSLYKQHTAYATETRRPTTHTRHQCDVYKKLTC